MTTRSAHRRRHSTVVERPKPSVPTLAELVAEQERLRPAAVEFERLKREVRRRLEAEGMTQTDRMYEIAGFRIVPRSISGGGFSVSEWESVGYRFVKLEAE